MYSAHWTPLLAARTDSGNVTAGAGTYKVTVTHNSSLTSLAFDLKSFALSLRFSGPVGFHGHASVSFPSKLLAGIDNVTLDNTVTLVSTPVQFEMNSTASVTSVGFSFDQGPDQTFKISGTASGNLTKTTSTTSTASSTSTPLTTATFTASSPGTTSQTTAGSVQGGGGITLTFATIFVVFIVGALVVGSLVGFVILPTRRKSSGKLGRAQVYPLI